MKSSGRKTPLILVTAFLLGSLLIPELALRNSKSDMRDDRSSYDDGGCTVIYGTDETNTLGGNNEDFSNPDTMIWFLPPTEGKFGRALVGYDGFVWQGGMNDQGLFFDAMSIEEPVQVEQGNKLKYQGSLPGKALETCADVDCVLDLFDEYHAFDTWAFQYLFGDASGNSVIIEPLQTNPGGRFLVGTNFLQSTTDENDCRYCLRYWTARSMFEGAATISVELMRDILKETQLGDENPTQYSTIYDLKQKQIYLYFFHDFEEVKVFDLTEELAKGYHVYKIVNLFPDNYYYMLFERTERARQQGLRIFYSPTEQDSLDYSNFLGDFQGPENLDMAFDYYSVDYVEGDFVLKMTPDRVWLKLEPISPTEFFHVSYFDNFKIAFLPEENGDVNRFIYRNQDGDFEFERIGEQQITEPEQETAPRTKWQSLWYKIWRFSGTVTFKFLAIILGLISLQALLQYLRSLIS
jgi:hypothetical protein